MTTTRIPDGQVMLQEMYTKKSTEMAEGLTESFANVMDRAESSKTEVTDLVSTEPSKQPVKAVESQGAKTSDTQKSQQTEKSESKVDTKSEDKAQALKTDSGKESKEVVSEKEQKAALSATDEVTKGLAEKLGITEEELMDIMQLLGLTVADLTEPNNMIQIMVQTNEEISAVSVMMDESLMNEMKDLVSFVSDTLSEIADEFGLTPEKLTEAIDEVLAMSTKEETTTVAMTEETVQFVPDTVVGAENLKDAKAVNAEQVEDSQVEATTVETSEDAEVKEVLSKEKGQMEDSKESEEDGQQMQNRSENVTMNAQEQPVNSQFQALTNDTELPQSYIDVEKAREIIAQVAEQVKVRASEQLTEMELQLNPANLGKINLQVAAKDGVITAQLTTSNEDVRNALEMQAMALKEELNQQGLKVEAVDVTVSSHEFERNLEEGQQDSAEEEAYKEELRKGTRKSIDLKELTMDDIAEMSEAEMIQIDMMNRRGNRMNLMA